MTLPELLQVPDDQRDWDWERTFLDAIIPANLTLIANEAKQGPDGWPYFLAQTADNATEPAAKILNWLATRGIGLVVNPEKSYPDYVFNYGMIWHFKETGLFVRPQDEVPPATKLELESGTGLLAGPPTPEYLPDYVRSIIREFFRDQSLLAVKILVMSQNRQHYDLAFSLESLGNPPEKEHQGIAEAIAWFLPPHYSLVLVSEKGLPAFTAL